MYVVKTDYYSRISTDLLNRIIQEAANNGDDLLATCSKFAEDTIATHANVIYDTSAEWAKAGAERNGLLLVWAINIATYNVYQRIDDEEVPQKVIKNFDDTMEDLQKVSSGKYPLSLPPKQLPGEGTGGSGGEDVVTDGGGLRRMGSQPKRSHAI